MNTELPKNVYVLFDAVRKRPGMFLTDGTRLSDLETMVHGYKFAIKIHGVAECTPTFDQQNFIKWLSSKTGIGGSLGWANILQEKYYDPDIALANFFELLDEYKSLPVDQL